ncbi:MAG: hypothetical protein FJX68_09545 [Alphaproteobacteria bacterium]|nr:hypothetical protein [Alphaproteobacteria bacterium]
MSPVEPKPRVGLLLPPLPTLLGAQRQRRYHRAAEVGEGCFDDEVDPALFANDCILARKPLKRPEVAGLHVSQRIEQFEPVTLGEALTAQARVVEVTARRNGTLVRARVAFARADGSVPVVGEIGSLETDAAAMRAKPRSGRPAEADALSDFVELSRKHPTEARVKDYSFEFPDYLVHFDPQVSDRLGLRSPVAQGLMSFSYMAEVMARGGPPRRFALWAEFRHPVFWDDRVRLLGRGREYLVLNEAGVICSTGGCSDLAG